MVWDYQEGQSLEDCLYAAIHTYDDSRAKHCDDFEGAARDVARALDHLGSQVIEGLSDLTAPAALQQVYAAGGTVPKLLSEMRSDSVRRVVLEHLQVALAFQYSTDVTARALRALEMSEFLLADAPPEAVVRYLRRLTKCYVAGFLPECVILCRGILENAIKDRFTAAGIDAPETQRQRINEAARLGWLSREGKESAHQVWTRGNKAVHDDPEVTKDVFGTIKMVAGVLRQLY